MLLAPDSPTLGENFKTILGMPSPRQRLRKWEFQIFTHLIEMDMLLEIAWIPTREAVSWAEPAQDRVEWYLKNDYNLVISKIVYYEIIFNYKSAMGKKINRKAQPAKKSDGSQLISKSRGRKADTPDSSLESFQDSCSTQYEESSWARSEGDEPVQLINFQEFEVVSKQSLFEQLLQES